MRKTAVIVLTVLVTVFIAACGGDKGLKAGSATGESLMKLLPEATRGVMVIDVARAVATTGTAKALEDEKARTAYEEFVKAVGIDPMKDVFYVVMGVTGPADAKEPDGAVLVNLRYEREPLLELVKGNVVEFAEEDYSGVALYKGRADDRTGRMACGAFLDDSNILVGTESAVKGVIDVYRKKAASMAGSVDLGRALKGVNKSAIAWGAMIVPPDLAGKAAEENPMFKVMEGITALTMSFDYRNRNLLIDMRTMGGTKDQNANLASTINGLKGLGAMMAGQEPALGEALAGIEITSGADYVRLYATLPEELLQKLQKIAQERLGDVFPAGRKPSGEEKE